MSNTSAAPQGPYDVADIDLNDGVERLDLGALLLTAMPGIDVNAQVDEESGAIGELSLAGFDGAVQVQPFAAPRSGGYWAEVMQQMLSQLDESQAGTAVVDGRFGPELHVVLHDDQGNATAARFAGIDGPRWFLRAVFFGAAARPGNAAAALDQAVAALVVVRGKEAMPAGAPLPLRIPNAPIAQAGTAILPNPFERGPEITEIR